QAADWASEYLREDPFDEPMSAFLMERWRETKKYAKAAQVYQRLKSCLSEDLGVDPQESTTMLYYEIMNQWNDTAQEPDGTPNDPVPVGREGACAALRAAADSFAEGAVRRCSQLLMGEVGSGKSELVNHFLRTGNRGSLLVLCCGCLQSEEQVSLAPWDRLMLSLLEFIQEENVPLPVPIRARLGRDFSVFRDSGAPPDHEGYRALRRADRELEDSVLMMIAAVARRKKVLLILEDLQWMDGESLRLTEAILRRMEGGGLMTLLTCRNDCCPMTRELLARAEADGLLRVHRLEPLSAEQTEELLRRELGETVAGQLAGQFYRETGGNPYLLIELTQAYRRSENVDATLHALGDILTERLSGLRENSLRVAELISVFPEEAPCSILLELMDRNDRLLTEGLEELRSRGLIEERRTEPESVCRFIHQRIRELVYDRLDDFQRRPLHLRVAELLAGGEPPQESAVCRRISRHFHLAGENLRALEYHILALDLESSRSCEPFALRGGESSLHLSPEQLEDEAQQCLRALIALRGENQDPETLTRLDRLLLLIRGRVALFLGNTERGTGILGGLSAAAVHRNDGVQVRACYLLAETSLLRQSADLAERYTATGMRLLERVRDPVQQAQFQRLRGNCFCLRGVYD
ncbi:MAG: AAA family ATPase, partial [Oscillospiraceae bacterium]